MMKANVNFAIFMFLTVLCGMADGRIISEYREIPDDEIKERNLHKLLSSGYGDMWQKYDGTFLRRNAPSAYRYEFHFNANGELHRDHDLPAVVRINDYQSFSSQLEWYRNGERHRGNELPAIEIFQMFYGRLEGKNEYFYDGKRYPDKMFAD